MIRIHAVAPAARFSVRRAWFRLVVTCLIMAGLLQYDAGLTLASQPAQTILAVALQQTIPDGASDGAAAWGDLDNDGDLDVVMTGRNNSGTETFVLRNTGGVMEKIATGMPGTEFGSLALGDFDRDGDLDIFITGQTGVFGGQETGMARVYANNGSGSFTLKQDLAALYRSAGDWGDYDNDGDLDLLVCGYTAGGGGYGALYRNDNGALVEMTDINVPDVGDCSVQFGDYSADEDLDFVITGKTSEDENATALARVLSNNGNGAFLTAYSPGGVWSGSVDWFDLESDGDLDLLITGNGGTSTNHIPITRLYRYESSFTQITTTLPGVWQSSTAWGDYDNDGDHDLLLNGLTTAQHLTRVYLNAGGGTFTDAQVGLQSGTGAALAWGHLDGDSSLDLFVTGIEDTNTTISTFVYRNISSIANTPPGTPTLVRGCWDGGSRVYLDWTGVTDSQTTRTGGITYNLRVGTGPGLANTVNPSAASSGLRQLAEPGNTQSRSDTFLQIPFGDYYWSVQAVDTAFSGGAFAAEGFFGVGVQIAVNDSSYYTAENTSVDLPVLDNDTTGFGNLSIAWAEDPPHGVVSVIGSVIRYTPDIGYTGPDSFGYYSQTGQGYCSRAVVSLTVTGIQLSNREIAENRPVGTYIGVFSTSDPDPGETFTYSLVSGDGDSDNSAFEIANSNELRSAIVFDYETRNTYSIRVRASGSLGSNYEKAFTILVTAPPTDIQLSNNTVLEGQPVNTVVGVFTSSDPEPGSTFTYQLVSGTGSTDNASFNILGAQLRTSVIFDYEIKNTYSIRVRSTDNHGLFLEEQFTIQVTNGGEVAPTDIVLSNNITHTGLPSGSFVGSLTTVGDPTHTFTYTLITQAGCPDSPSFTITGDTLNTARSFDLDDQELSICIRSTDDQNNLSLVENFVIQVYRRTFLPVIFRP